MQKTGSKSLFPLAAVISIILFSSFSHTDFTCTSVDSNKTSIDSVKTSADSVKTSAEFVKQKRTDFVFKGQLSGWGNYSSSESLPFNFGARYLPQADFQISTRSKKFNFDFELAANVYGSSSAGSLRKTEWEGDARLYRGWAKISTDKAELRIGLQKINFGSATMLRPLMWFDRIDPRDPLQLTDGVWGVLGRYYFGNNTNIWLWGLYGNKELRPWEVGNTIGNIPEFGGRIQFALPKGEVAFTYHHREVASPSDITSGENRIAIDFKFDLVVGLWAEASYTKKEKDLWAYNNQAMLNIGADYTFGIGNGLNVVFEHLVLSYDKTPFEFGNTQNLSAISLGYPTGLLDNISYMLFYDWKNGGIYNFVNWKHNFKYTSLYVMGYINPDNFLLSGGGIASSRFAGKGIQIMLVFNHQTKK